MKHYIIDIETNGLVNPDKIWCAVVEDLNSDKVWEFTDWHSFNTWFCKIDKCLFIGHNIIEFDAPQLKKLWLTIIKEDQLIDTLILSRLYSPKLEGGHSLEAWGQRLNFPKLEHEDFSKCTPELLERCRQDVKLNKKLYLYLMKLIGEQKDAIQLEHELAFALRDATNYGFYFDINSAINLKFDLEKEREYYDGIIHTAYPPTLVGKRVKKLVYFNPNSAKQVIDKLIEAGWTPTEKTDGHKELPSKRKEIGEDAYAKKAQRYDKYGWKLNEVNLSSLPEDAPEAVKCILKRTIYETRIRKLDEWLELVDEDHCIHGTIISLGTWTHRMAHRHPNMANISAKKSIKYKTKELNELASKLGGQMRALWQSKPGRVLVGTDAEGIQLRVLAHYMEDEEFTKAVTEGNKNDKTDPHSFNQRRIGLGTRDNAKTFIYAFLLGAGDEKIGEIYGISTTEGKRLKTNFIETTPGLFRLKNQRIPAEADRGFTIGFDGRRIYCDSRHLMMAAYLQGGESIIMKVATVIALKEIKRRKLDAHLVNIVHDEMIFDCLPSHAYRVLCITEEAIKKAGEVLNLKCPMKGEGKMGLNWLKVH